MSVFKTFYKIVNKYKGTIILYTVMLIVFGGISMSSKEVSTTFTDSKTDLLIINNDKDTIITDNLIKYLSDNSNIVEVENDEEKISDALFYRDVNYIVYIPENYTDDLINMRNPSIQVKSTHDYMSSLEEMMLSNYLDLQNIYLELTKDSTTLVNLINDTLSVKNNVILTSKVDTSSVSKVSRYFNFGSYSILAIIIFIITLVLNSFKEKTINKRVIVSSMNYKRHNSLLLRSSVLYVIFVWILYSILAFIMLGKSILNINGVLLIINALIFSLQALSFSFLVSTLVNNKDAIGGIVNTTALGSAFLCGAFIPTSYLPDGVRVFSHVFPAYYYNNSNDLIVLLNKYNFSSLKPIIENSIIMIIFMIVFIIINNMIVKNKRILR